MSVEFSVEVRKFLDSMAPEKVPVGFRFCPTDLELVSHYLKRKMDGRLRPIDQFMVPDVEAYSTDPWELCGKSNFQSNDDGVWFFFSSKLVKFRGQRIYNNRSTLSGHWKITGVDVNITESPGSPVVLAKKRTLVFHMNSGERTVWAIHEFTTSNDQDEFILCRLTKKPLETLFKKRKPKDIACEMEDNGSSLFATSSTPGGSLKHTFSMPPVGINIQSADNTVLATKHSWDDSKSSSTGHLITDEARKQVGYTAQDYSKLEVSRGRISPDNYKMQEEPIQDGWIHVDTENLWTGDTSISAMMDHLFDDPGISPAGHIDPQNEENTEHLVTKCVDPNSSALAFSSWIFPQEPLIPTETEFLTGPFSNIENQTNGRVLEGAGTQTRTPQHFLSSEDFAGYQDLVTKRSHMQKFICNRSTTQSEKYITAPNNDVYNACITEVGEYDNKHLIHGRRTPYDATERNSLLGEPKKNDYSDSICCSEAVHQPNSLLKLTRRMPESSEQRFLAAPATDSNFTAEYLAALLLAILLFIAVLMIYYFAYIARH